MELMCECLLFDLDGVLIDSSSCIMRHWKAWAQKHRLDLANVMRIAHGMRTVETMQAVAPHLDADREAEEFTAAEVLDTEGVIAIEGARALLDGLPADRWGIVTSGSRKLAMARLRSAGLPIPGVLVTGDEVGRGKPAPYPYLEGARRLGWPAEKCIAIEDAPSGIESARAAGMQVIGIASTHRRRELDCLIIVDRLTALSVGVRGEGEPQLVVTLGLG
jgi:sugar-phosphatase